MMEGFESQKVISVGGLNSNINHLQLSDNEPGCAVELLNFEPSLHGGYRRLTGFAKFLANAPEVDPVGAEGRILAVAFLGSDVIAARKQKSGDTYEFYMSSGTDWTKLTTGLTLNSLGVDRIRWAEFNFDGTDKIIFVDGVNQAVIFDGTTWTQVKSTNDGSTYALAGGDQVIDNPKYVEIFKNHIFLASDNLVVHSAPLSDYNWTVAAGAGQLPAGYEINQIKAFRDSLIVFGVNKIKKIDVSGETFILNSVTSDIGCIAPDSVAEFNSNLIFLSQDGFRPVEGTERINDLELNSLSRRIQSALNNLSSTISLSDLSSVLIRSKSQVRFFFNNPTISAEETYGILVGLRDYQGSLLWEWAQMKGIQASCTASKYIGAREVILHGDYEGRVYQQEVGSTFDGHPVDAVYTTPFLDFQNPGVRKTMSKIKLFVRPEGNLNLFCRLSFDWMDPEKLNPDAYTLESTLSSTVSIYGTAIWDSSVYTSASVPILMSNVQGSGYSVQISLSTSDTNAPYTIQGALFEFNMEGRK